jgi:hypothetical protein
MWYRSNIMMDCNNDHALHILSFSKHLISKVKYRPLLREGTLFMQEFLKRTGQGLYRLPWTRVGVERSPL